MLDRLAKLLPLLAIVIATPVFAASNYPNHSQERGQIARGEGKRMNNLNLTPEQKTKMQQLRASTQSQIDAVLTDEQRQKLAQVKAQRPAKARQDRRQAMGDTWKSLNLTTEQQARIKTIRQSSKQQLNAILTPEQQTKLKSFKRDRGYNPT